MNFWTGLFIGKLLFGKKDGDNTSFGEKVLGFIYIIVAFLLFIITFFDSHSFLRALLTAIFVPFIFIVGIRLLVLILKNILTHNKTVADAALALYNEGQFTQAYEKALPIAEKNPLAAYIAGMCLRFGDGCNKDEQKAFEYFAMSKEKNYYSATMYGVMCMDGIGCNQNLEEGLEYVRRGAVIENIPYAQYRYGAALFYGNGCAQNTNEGMKYIRMAVDANESCAKYELGTILYEGKNGIPQDKQNGLFYLRKASEEGDADASNYLAQIGE